MTVIDSWTARKACKLQAAFRMSNEAFAECLGVAVRTIAAWHSRPGIVPRPEMQQILDTALENSSNGEKSRFLFLLDSSSALISHSENDFSQDRNVQALRVAVAVVVRDSDLLLVHRRDGNEGISWQFPAGIVKPGDSPSTVAVHETLAETGVHCSIREELGSRLHPSTKVYCTYFRCAYLTGEVENRDIVENLNVIWVPKQTITEFVPEQSIYPPILKVLSTNG